MIMEIHIQSNKRKNKPSVGDVKTDRTGVYTRVHRKTRSGSFVMMGGKPVYDWNKTGETPEGFKGRAIIKYKH